MFIDKKRERQLRDMANTQYGEKKGYPFFMYTGTQKDIDSRWDFKTIAFERKIIKTYCLAFISLLQLYTKVFYISGCLAFMFMFVHGIAPIDYCLLFVALMLGLDYIETLLDFLTINLNFLKNFLIRLFHFIKKSFFYLRNYKNIFIFFNLWQSKVVNRKLASASALGNREKFSQSMANLKSTVINYGCYLLLVIQFILFSLIYVVKTSLYFICVYTSIFLMKNIQFLGLLVLTIYELIFTFVFVICLKFYIKFMLTKEEVAAYEAINKSKSEKNKNMKKEPIIEFKFKRIIINFFDASAWRFSWLRKLNQYFKITEYYALFENYVRRFVAYSKFFFKLIFTFKNTAIFHDRYVFMSWDEIDDEDLLIKEYRIEYKFQKYYAERKYFGLESYWEWQFYMLLYKILNPLSYYIHYFEWKTAVHEYYVFNVLEYTVLEQFFIDRYRYFDHYFLTTKKNKHLKYALYDVLSFIWFFIIEDLILYTMQFGVIFKWWYKQFWVFWLYVLSVWKDYKSYWVFVRWFFNFKFFFIKKNLIVTYCLKLKNKYFTYSYWILLGYFIINYFMIVFLTIFWKLFRFFHNVYLVIRFLSYKKHLTFFRRFKILYDYFLIKLYILLVTKFRLKASYKKQDMYFIDIAERIRYKAEMDSLRDPDLNIDAIIAKNIKKDDYYLFFKRFFIFKNIDKIVKNIAERRKVYASIRKILHAFQDMPYYKDIDDLTEHDSLTEHGAVVIYRKIELIYDNYIESKKRARKLQIKNFRKKKNNYFVLIKKKQNKNSKKND